MTTKKNELFEWVKALIIAILLAAVIRYFLFAPIVVDGESMMPTLNNTDRMIVNKISYTIGEPHRFDIVVFHANAEKDYIKRVIGLPGDHVEYKDDTLYINGEKFEEPYLDEKKKELIAGTPLTDPFEVTVPDGELFVLGDNRRASRDSRHIGTIPIDEVLGKTSVVYWPFSQIRIAN
ncbi:signal peptidase I [Cytobacillus sp. IB215665]|uniref:signal peptidase I n=1 Tax=Cytobacillus sp. IB215665 TaxID=3097357 RepID=UPI002A0C0375|nr:signal peptidase I [Cytobacillus sp. IB215665]MDX8365044.1 signal peptidase I [Cytobacillus sp. IB215665]